MATGAAFFADTDLSHIQTDIVGDYDQFRGVIHLVIIHDLPDALTAQIHESLGLRQDHLLSSHIALADQRLMLTLHDGDIFFLC